MIPAITTTVTTAAITVITEADLITTIITTTRLIFILIPYGELDMPSGKGICAPL
jgi:hypothetical protein